MERNQLIQQLNHLDTEIQHDNIILENTEMRTSTSKKEPPHVARSEFSIPKPFVFQAVTERQK